jgi:large subunit ribosomal protein L15
VVLVQAKVKHPVKAIKVRKLVQAAIIKSVLKAVRRIPKSGFNSMKSLITDELRMSDLNKIAKDVTVVDLATLISAGLIRQTIKHVKIISFGKIERAFTVKGIPVTAGARQAIEAAGGKIEE